MKKNLPYLIVFACVCIIFQIKFSFEILDVGNINWLMLLGSDRTPDFLAWEFYRTTAWQFPIGIIEGYSYPNISSVGLTGAIPLFAIPLKLFEPFLPVHFQYFGIWFFLCYIMQGFFAIKIFKSLGVKNLLFLCLFSVIIVLTPAFLDRTEHMNLCCHWILLYAIWTYIQTGGMQSKKKHILAFNALFALTHPYLIVFGIVMTTAIALKEWYLNRISLVQSLLWIGLGIIEILSIWYVVGNFVISSESGKGWGLGVYSTNLNSFFNSLDKAFIFPALPTFHNGQYEGFAYLGLGVIILLVANFKAIFRKTKKKANKPILWAAILLFIFSLSNVISFFGMHGEIPLPKPLLSIGETFRSTGRYVWLSNYLIFFVTLQAFYQWTLKAHLKRIILVSIFIIQVVDCHSLLFLSPFDHTEYKAPLTNEVWENLISEAEKINVYPPYIRNINTYGDFIHFAHWAYIYEIPISCGHLARFDQGQRNAYHQYLDSLMHNSLSAEEKNSLFITTIKYADRFKALEDKGELILRELDGYVLGLPADNSSFMEILDKNSTTLKQPKYNNLEDLISKYVDNWILIALRDEGTRNLCQNFKNEMDSLGSNINQLAYRGSYLAILKGPQILFEEINNEGAIEKSFLKNDLIKDQLFPVPLKLKSAGNQFGNEVLIEVDAERVDQNDRGLNIVILDTTGLKLESFVVDTYESCLY